MVDVAKSQSICRYLGENTICTSHIRMFSKLPQSIQEEIVEGAIRSSHEKGSYLVHENDKIQSVLILRSGMVKTCWTDTRGEEHILDVLHDGQAIWHGIFLQDQVYHYDIVCLTDVELCAVSRHRIRKIFHQHPDIALQMLEKMSEELDQAEKRIMYLGIRNPKQRLARFLLNKDHHCLGDEIHLKLNEIAFSINLTPETVSRNNAKLEKEGAIKRLGQGRIMVISRDRLQEIAG